MTCADGERPGFDRGALLQGEAPMTRITSSRPRVAAICVPGTVRARRWHGDGDVRGYRLPSGWTARAAWWIIETKE